MTPKNHYTTLGVKPEAAQADIKRAYRKLARKFHPDVSKEPNAEARFKDVAEAHEALIDPERRAAYDESLHAPEPAARRPPPRGNGGGFSFGDAGDNPADQQAYDDMLSSLFGRGGPGRRAAGPEPGDDQHARVEVDLEDLYQGARRTISWSLPVVDAQGHAGLRERRLEVDIPRGMHPGQQLRLAGEGGPGYRGGPAGDLYLEIALHLHRRFRVDGRDVSVDLPVAPWEAALGASVPTPTPEGAVSLTIPPGSRAGRRLRLKGRGLPGTPPGDLYAVLSIALPTPESAAAKDAYLALSKAFPGYDPRAA